MNGGHAFQSIEDIQRASFHADLHSLRGALGAPSEPPPSSARCEAATRPCADPFADTMAPPTSLRGNERDWCVDVGPELLTMTTFELWESLERGQVLAWMRVWRDGMECWTPVGEIAEFAWATAVTPAPSGPEPQCDPAPVAEESTGGPRVAPAPSEPPPCSTIRPTPHASLSLAGGARWVALGSVVAVVAVIAATFAQREPPPSPAVPLPGATPAQAHLADAPTPHFADAPGPDAEGARHEERGQHRLPRGGGRAYGR